jgi:hypothetical protein
MKCLVVRCNSTKALFGHVIPCKGADEDGIVADMVVQDVLWLGHTRVILKADGEAAIQALVRRAMELARVECKELDQLAKEDPAAYDSQSNGGTEIGVRMIRGLFRTLKLCLEARIDKYIPIDHPIIAWMMQHVCLPGRSLQTPAGYKEGNFPCDRNARNGRTVCGPSTCALRYRT